jgi:hypothetical protein
MVDPYGMYFFGVCFVVRRLSRMLTDDYMFERMLAAFLLTKR